MHRENIFFAHIHISFVLQLVKHYFLIRLIQVVLQTLIFILHHKCTILVLWSSWICVVSLIDRIFFFIYYAGINFIHNHPPPGHDLKGAKTLPPGQSLCTKTLPSGQKRDSKAPPPGHNVGEFHKHIYKL